MAASKILFQRILQSPSTNLSPHLQIVNTRYYSTCSPKAGVQMCRYFSNISKSSDSLTHVDAAGKANMVNVGHKNVSKRSATASGKVFVGAKVATLIRSNSMKKGDVLTVARIAGIQGAKRTSEMIPLCHNIFISAIKVDAALEDTTDSITITATVQSEGKTGVEMEALTAVTIAALTVYDMCKAVTHDIVIQDIKLMEKTGGVRGDFKRNSED